MTLLKKKQNKTKQKTKKQENLEFMEKKIWKKTLTYLKKKQQTNKQPNSLRLWPRKGDLI